MEQMSDKQRNIFPGFRNAKNLKKTARTQIHQPK